jgi:RNA polymerase sigma-70 factor, ECF subfamily
VRPLSRPVQRTNGKSPPRVSFLRKKVGAKIHTMAGEGLGDITRLLAAWSDGREDGLNALMPAVYQELRRIARKHLANQSPGQTLESAALVNEAYLKLAGRESIRCESSLQFFALCAKIIRHILVDHARDRMCSKRGTGAAHLPLDEAVLSTPLPNADLLALDVALTALSRIDSRKARVVELRHFAGLSVEEAAAVLRISRETAQRDWKMAKAWLLRELTGTRNHPAIRADAPER